MRIRRYGQSAFLLTGAQHRVFVDPADAFLDAGCRVERLKTSEADAEPLLGSRRGSSRRTACGAARRGVSVP